MTITESHRQFRLLIDKMDGLNVPNFRPEEIDVILNLGYRRWTKQRYGKNNPKRTSFEEEQKRIEDLRGLLKQKLVVNFGSQTYENINYKSVRIPLAADHWFTVQENAVMTYTGCSVTTTVPVDEHEDFEGQDIVNGLTTIFGKYVKIIPTTHLEFETVIKDPFKGPDRDKILRLMYQDTTELILPAAGTLTLYRMRYIKKPTDVSLTGNITFETADHTHDEIVAEAVKIALEGIEAKRTGTFVPLIDNTKE